MSLSCVLGMHDIIWNNTGSRSCKHPVRHVAKLDSLHSIMSTTRIINPNSSPAGHQRIANSNSAFQNGGGGKKDGSNMGFLFQSNGVGPGFGEGNQEGFHGQWSVGQDSEPRENGEDIEELGGEFQAISIDERKSKEIMVVPKKIWDDPEENNKGNGKGMFFENQWQDSAWTIPSSEVKSEHAVSKPIMMQRRPNQSGFHQPNQVVSPRSADGNLGVCMVEYVLASSPGGHDLESRIKELNGNLDSPSEGEPPKGIVMGPRKSPFDDPDDSEVTSVIEMPGEDRKSRQSQLSEDDQSPFSRTPGSRQQSPNPSTQSQDAPPLGQIGNQAAVQTTKPGGIAGPVSSDDQISSPVQFINHIDPSAIGIETLPFSYQSQQGTVGLSADGMTPTQGVSGQQQQQQATQIFLGPNQQQPVGVALASNPYFVTNGTPQDPYGGNGLSVLNAGGQPTVIHPQYAPAYGIQPWVYTNANGNTAFVQQQTQQMQGGQASRTQASGSRTTNDGLTVGQQVNAPGGYQLIQGPLSIPAGATFYDQQGNPVIINGRVAAPLTNQLGQPMRMMSPVVLNAAPGATAVSPGMPNGTSPAMQLFGAQQQQQQSQSQQQQRQQQTSLNLGYLSTGAFGATSGLSNLSVQNGGPVGVIGGHLQSNGTSSMASSVGNNQGRRDPYGAMDPTKARNVTQVYPNVVGSPYNSLSVNTPLANSLPMGDPNTSPLHTQGQTSFNIGSPVNNRLSGYMSLLNMRGERKYRSNSGSLSGTNSIFGTTSATIYGRRSGRDTGRSKLLEDFRNNRYPNLQLRDLSGHIVEFSQDQHGSRFIQQKLERASHLEKNMVFNEILQAAYSLMTDVFGNYVIQKFFEFGSSEQKLALAHRIKGHVLPLALQMYGCRVIQKALETIPGEIQNDLVHELDGHVLKCVKDQNGNHVVQKCIECVDSGQLQFIIDAFRGQVYALSTHPYGCRVIQRILEHCTPEQTGSILAELHDSTDRLVQDQYGNYVIQHVLEHGSEEDRARIVGIVRGNVLILSQHKFASNVVEKCVSHASRNERAILIDEVCHYNDGLYTMMKDQYANYVVQKMIDVAEPMQKKLLMHKIRPHVATLRKFTYGKHILAKLEKLEKNFYLKPNMDLVFMPPNGQAL